MEHSLRHHVGAHGEEGRWQVLLITATDDIAHGVGHKAIGARTTRRGELVGQDVMFVAW